MPRASTRAGRRASPPDGVTTIEGAESGFVVWSASYRKLERRLLRSAERLARRVAQGEASGIAFDLGELAVPSAERTAAVVRFVDELQLRGRSVVLHGASASFLTAVQIEDSPARLATCADLAACVGVLREYDEMRRRCTSERGSGIHQLRMPARALSLAPLCLFVRKRLEHGRVPDEIVLDLLRETYAAMVTVLEESYEPGAADLAAAVTVHEARATITILDSGRPRENEVILPGEKARVDRIHRFRILDRHNAWVLEKELGAGSQPG